MIGMLVSQFFPEVARYGAFCAALGSGLGLMFARDNNVTSEQAGAKPVFPAGVVRLLFLLLLPALFFTGCTLSKPKGKILSVTERGIGFVIGQRPDNQTPEVKFGFFSSAVVIIPTDTNEVYSPNFANTFNFDQASATKLGIGEDIASGNYQTFRPGGTNSAPVVIPK